MVDLVTGAFSFSGSYIARKLLEDRERIRTLTGHPRTAEYADRVDVQPYNFESHEKMVRSLEGVENFINTYWIRFPKGKMTWEKAIENSKMLFDACKDAGVNRIIHLSVTNPSSDSPYPYFRGKSRVEEHLKNSGVPHSIVRPALIFEKEDILLNNISFLLRKLPVFAIFGNGNFKIQPISQQDLAETVVNECNQHGNRTIDAIGPETLTFREMVQMLNKATGSRTLILNFPGMLRWIPFTMSKLFGIILRDVLLTRHEMEALRDNLLCTESPPTGKTKFSEWIEQTTDLGMTYAHEIKRHYK